MPDKPPLKPPRNRPLISFATGGPEAQPLIDLPQERLPPPPGWMQFLSDAVLGAAGLKGDLTAPPGSAPPSWGTLLGMAATAPVAGLKSLRAVVKGEQAAETAAEVAQAARRGIRAYHGSPHDFERFDVSKIGTGEGAQAYGHGLYFAENEATADTYRNALANPEVVIGGKPVRFPPWSPDLPPEDRLIRRLGDKRTADPKASESDLVAQIRAELESENQVRFGNWPSDAQRAANQEQVRLLDDWAKQGITTRKGRMYEVNINADPEHFLDWDKPLSQQSPAVQKVFENPMFQARLRGEAAITGRTDPTGADLYRMLGAGPDQGSTWLRERGIPGIRYLDQGSRTGGTGTYNYSVNTDALVDILRKYGWLPPVAGLGALSQVGQPKPETAR